MSLDPQEKVENSDFLSFNSSNRISDSGTNVRHNFQHRPYNRNYRSNQFIGGRNDGDSQFAPSNFSSPYQPRFRNRSYQFNNQRNFKKFGGNHQRGHDVDSKNIPIQQYFHSSMMEDPWSDCYKFNGTIKPESQYETLTPNELTTKT